MSQLPSSPDETPISARLADGPAPPTAPAFDQRPMGVPTSLSGAEAANPQSRPTADPAESHRRMVGAEHVEPRSRRIVIPVVLFLLTCLSTFWAGCAPAHADLVLNYAFSVLPKMLGMASNFDSYDASIRLAVLENWHNGLIYMACVLAILFAHEMGHFLMTLRYKIEASLPYFLPVPFTPIGTMGAVISMDGLSANRKQIFDIGIAGPLAGLVLAIPITWYGVTQVDLVQKTFETRQEQLADERAQHEGFGFHMPWTVGAMARQIRPSGYNERAGLTELTTHTMNPYLMAGWVGLLITGLNMMPISQLDGGHVIYALFGKRAHIIARVALFMAIFLVALNFEKVFFWTVMLILVTLMGSDHPPTADDNVSLGPFRTALGWASLSIPFLCFPYLGLWPLVMA